MTLFPDWQGDLVLPPLSERKIRVGSNLIFQCPFRGARCRPQIAPSQYKGHDLIKTNLAAPFDQILLRRKGARRLESTLPVLNAGHLSGLGDLTDSTALFWDSPGALEDYAATPEQVLALWRNKFTFRAENEVEQERRLRMPQIGSLHAIATHFAVGEQFEPATVVLPTGTGKTETMLATQVYRQLYWTLVLMPASSPGNFPARMSQRSPQACNRSRNVAR